MNKMKKHIKKLDLKPHIEGGYFKEIYTSSKMIEDRSIASSIYFLLEKGDFSAFHIIGQDEQWIYVDGSSMKVHMISESGEYSFIKVGMDYKNGEVPSFVVPADTYFASEPMGEYSLVVCNVFPAFKYEDFRLPIRDELVKMFAEHTEIISRLTK